MLTEEYSYTHFLKEFLYPNPNFTPTLAISINNRVT